MLVIGSGAGGAAMAALEGDGKIQLDDQVPGRREALRFAGGLARRGLGRSGVARRAGVRGRRCQGPDRGARLGARDDADGRVGRPR